jgi:hypothetical protein
MNFDYINKNIMKELFYYGFTKDRFKNNIYTKSGDFNFQHAVIELEEKNNECFNVLLSFEIHTSKGILPYLQPFYKRKNGFYSLDATANILYFCLSSDKTLIPFCLESNKKSICWKYDSLNIFLDYFKSDVLSVIDKYLNPIKHIEYIMSVGHKDKYGYLLSVAVIHEQLTNIELAIKNLEGYVQQRKSLGRIKEDELENFNAYLDYLKNGTPLPDIKDPYDTMSVFHLTGNDIYIALNKKSIKDTDILEYFGGANSFEKGEKTECNDAMSFEEGIGICKAGKWSLLRLNFDIFATYDQQQMEILLKTLSEKYIRAILFVNQDTSNTFGFEIYKNGGALRQWMFGGDEVLLNEGKALSGEKKRFGDTPTEDNDASEVTSFLDSIIKVTYEDTEKAKATIYMKR